MRSWSNCGGRSGNDSEQFGQAERDGLLAQRVGFAAWVNSEQARAFLVEAEALMGTADLNGFGQAEASSEKASEK